MSDHPPPVHPRPTADSNRPLTPDRIDAILTDFRAWLESSGQAAAEPPNLMVLAREFTALRHEVNLQTKATRAAIEKIAPAADPREAQRPLVAALVEIADALSIAYTRAAVGVGPPPGPATRSRWLFRPAADPALQAWIATAQARLTAVADGYALSLKRVERALTAVGLEPIPTLGERFDPTMMEAIELADGGEQPSGTVLAESRRGYRWSGELFRFAQVTVSR